MYPRVEEEIEVLVQQSLVLLVPHTELLQEQMSVPDDLLHLYIMLQTDRDMRRVSIGSFTFTNLTYCADVFYL